MMALDFDGGAPPGSAQKWPSPFAFPALSAPILRRSIAGRIRTAGVHRERITTTIRALKTRDPQLGASMEETHLTFQSEAIGNISPSSTTLPIAELRRGRESTHIRRDDDERSSQGNPYIDSSGAVS